MRYALWVSLDGKTVARWFAWCFVFVNVALSLHCLHLVKIKQGDVSFL